MTWWEREKKILAWIWRPAFAFSSWLYLILILWLFSDHIQMGNHDEMEMVQKTPYRILITLTHWTSFSFKLFMMSSATPLHYLSLSLSLEQYLTCLWLPCHRFMSIRICGSMDFLLLMWLICIEIEKLSKKKREKIVKRKRHFNFRSNKLTINLCRYSQSHLTHHLKGSRESEKICDTTRLRSLINSVSDGLFFALTLSAFQHSHCLSLSPPPHAPLRHHRDKHQAKKSELNNNKQDIHNTNTAIAFTQTV
jgi:hypothetical protein